MRQKPHLVFHLIVVGLVIGTAACSPPPPLTFAVQDITPASSKLDADLRSITVVLAQPTEKTGRLPVASSVVVEPWKEALTDAVNRSALFNDDSAKHVNLAIKILKLDPPTFGVTMVTDVEARYQILDRGDGHAIFDQVIPSKGETEMGFSMIGAIRARESVNRAVKNNIKAFLDFAQASSLARRAEPVVSENITRR